MGNDVLTCWAILRVTVGVEAFLPYVEPSDRGRFLCCLDRLCRLVMYDPWFNGFVGFHCEVNISLTLSTEHFRMSYSLEVVAIYDVLSRAASDARV